MAKCPPNSFKIYLGKSLEELDKKSEHFPSPKIKSLPVLRLCNCCRTLMNEAITSYELGDQEMAYVKYNRYFTILHIIRASSDYNKHKKEVNKILGTNKEHVESVSRLEMLIDSLKPRYEQLAANEKQYNQVIGLDNLYKSKTKQKESAYFPTIAPSKTECPGDQLPSLSCRQYITCNELYEMLTNFYSTSSKEIIIDCRPYKDYSESSIIHPCCLNIDEGKIKLGVTAAQLVSTLTPLEMLVWKTRENMNHVIIFDWNTIEDEPIHDSPLHTLMGILNLWDPDVNYKSLKFLKGGYEEFLTLYPQYTTNAKIKPPARICPIEDDVSEIEYPSIADITMKEETFNVQLKNVPFINRETKPGSLKKYNSKNIKEMVEKREELADKSVYLEKKRLVLEEEIKKALIEQECAQDEQTKDEVIEKVTQLEYDVMQLENSKQDIAEERCIVSDQIIEEQASVPDAVPMDKIKQIEEKECEAQKLNEMNEKLAREKRLSQTREITPSKVPVIDRTVKPKMPFDVQRELEPVVPAPNVIVNRGLTGLKNMGNTCYMNSILQCISNTNSLTINFIVKVYKKYMNKSDAPGSVIAEHVANLVRALWSGKYVKLTPKMIYEAFGAVYPNFATNQQQDAHEFLLMLIDSLHSALRAMPPQTSSPKANSAEKAWMAFKAKNESIIMDLFYGQMKSTVKCTLCCHESSKHEPFTDLSLELPEAQNDRRLTLFDCLSLYFNGELVEGWRCPKCGQCGNAVKKLDIVRLPSVLVVHLKRFFYGYEGGEKICSYIDFPKENLEMNNYVAPSELRNIQNNHTLNGDYKLYAIVNHYGDISRGHYTAYCRNSILKRWYQFNDHTVQAVNESSLVSSAAYILFYSKLSESAPPDCS